MTTYFGKYRGKVENNADPAKLGRVQVKVPALAGVVTDWAMPCVPYAGNKVGLLAIPAKGTNVWVEFEAGNIDYPIWTGAFWSEGEMPVDSPRPDMKIIRTESTEIRIDDKQNSGGLTLRIGEPAVKIPITVVASGKGVEITCQHATWKMTDKEMSVTTSSGSLVVSGKCVEVRHGSGSIKVEGSRVTVNDGALEVT